MPAFYCILLSKHSLFIKLSSCHAIIRLTNVTQVSSTGTPGHILVNRYTRIKPPFESTCVPSVASRFPLCIQYVISKFIYLNFVIHLIRRDHEISVPQPLEFTSALAILTSIPLLYKIISKRFRRGIHILVSSKSTALLVIWERWESANIDFICFANKGVNHPHRK